MHFHVRPVLTGTVSTHEALALSTVLRGSFSARGHPYGDSVQCPTLQTVLDPSALLSRIFPNCFHRPRKNNHLVFIFVLKIVLFIS